MDAKSTVSETDRMLFTVLANPDKVDLSAIDDSPSPCIEDITDKMDPIPEHRSYSPSLPVFDEIPPYNAERETQREAERERETQREAERERETQREAEREREAQREREEMERLRQPEQSLPDIPVPDIPVPDIPVPDPVPETQPTPTPQPGTEFNPPPIVDDEDTRRAVLLDLRQLEMQGVKLSKEWTLQDRTEDMMLEMRRITLAMDEQSNVNMMRDGLRIAVTGIEMANNRIGLLDLEGWSGEVCRDLNKHDANLGRIYRKYWKRSHSTSPEMDILMSVVGSMGMYHMKRKMSKQILGKGARGAGGGLGGLGGFPGFGGGNPFAAFQKGGAGGGGGRDRPASPDSSDDEQAPP
jgi:hypothetical protein